MCLSKSLLEDYAILEEKLIWIDIFTEHLNGIARKTADLYFRASLSPRNVGWNDNFLVELVELCDNNRKINDEFIEILNTEYLKESETLKSEIKKEVEKINTIINTDKNLSAELIKKLKIQLEFYKDSWIKRGKDPWLSEFELKELFKQHLKYKNNIKMRFIEEKDAFMSNYNNCIKKYNFIVKNLFTIIRNHFLNLANTSSVNVSSKKSNNLIFYDALESNSLSYLDEKIDDEKEYLHFITETHNYILSQKITPKSNLNVKKYCLCKLKYYSGFQMRFLVLTETKYIHFYEIKDLNQEYGDFKDLITKINRIPFNIFSSMIYTDDKLSNEELNSLQLLNNAIFGRLSRYKAIDAESIYILDKRTKINRGSVEYIIYLNFSNKIFSFMGGNKVVIKGFTLFDLFEILKCLDDTSTGKIEIAKKEEFSKGKMDKNIEKMQVNIIENEELDKNPWL